MKRFGLVAGLVMAVAMGQAFSGDVDIQRLQERLAAQDARMAAQDARMNDLQAKIAGGIYGSGGESSADNIISLQKNAKVTIGGLATTKYTYTGGSVSSVYMEDDAGDIIDAGSRGTRVRSKAGSLALSDAELYVGIDVNEHFDAYLSIDLQNDARDYFIAQSYYVRWKDICNTGFGLKIGRDSLVFGEEGIGELGSYAAGGGDGLSELGHRFDMFAGYDGIVPMHNGWDIDGVVQINPYWEGLDGKLKLELSFMSSMYDDSPHMDWDGVYYHRVNRDGVYKTRTRDYGIGSMSMRATYEPIENLKFTFGVVNYHNNGRDDYDVNGDPDYSYAPDTGYSKNNTAFALAAGWRPAFMERFYFWGQWIHGNNVYNYSGMRSDAINYGASFDISDRLTVFAQGDYLRTRHKFGGINNKATAWAFYTGLQYNWGHGVSLEAGWKHESIRYREGGRTTAKARGNTVYALAGFEF